MAIELNRPDAVLVPPAEYESGGNSLSETVAMLLAAVATGVRIPSETLEALDLGASGLDWRALNAFQAHHPIAITHDEDGQPLPLFDVRLEHTPVEEDGQELRLSS